MRVGVVAFSDARTVVRPTAGGGSLDRTRCQIILDLAEIRDEARRSALPFTELVAVFVAHEQEHCRRGADARETPAIDAEVRRARQLGNPRLRRYSQSRYGDLDASGHWRS